MKLLMLQQAEQQTRRGVRSTVRTRADALNTAEASSVRTTNIPSRRANLPAFAQRAAVGRFEEGWAGRSARSNPR